jgi:hypothetical protein
MQGEPKWFNTRGLSYGNIMLMGIWPLWVWERGITKHFTSMITVALNMIFQPEQ